MERTIIKTADGSHSIFVKDLDEHYHSIHGAIQESNHVFIEAGLKYFLTQNKPSINILEVGLGIGLNAFLTFIETEPTNTKINYIGLEAYPIENNLIHELNYVELLTNNTEDKLHLENIFQLIHSDWEKQIPLSNNFILHKIKSTLQEVQLNSHYDLIYFDAFAPTVQPELWTEEIFSKLFNVTNTDGCIVTYCAKGEVKRTLKKVGFTVESLPGPPGKREMIRAIKK
jgi:tRNA U34 5-methylaminomethyl-2-thiouridine-forming methyltransferase MnmC